MTKSERELLAAMAQGILWLLRYHNPPIFEDHDHFVARGIVKALERLDEIPR